MANRQKNNDALAAKNRGPDYVKLDDPGKQASALADSSPQGQKPTAAKAFIDHIHDVGPNSSSLQAYYFDVGMYCRYGGPRCSAYQAKYREMENASNQSNARANQERLNGVYNKGAGGSGTSTSTGYGQATTDRYNAAVKSAAEKERVRVRNEQWKKKN